MIQDGQGDRLEHYGFGDWPLYPEDRRPGEIAVAFGVTLDAAAEAVGLEVAQGGVVHHPGVMQESELAGAEAEALKRVEKPAGARDHAVPPAVRQMAREDLEDRPPVRCAAPQCRGQHGQLVGRARSCCSTWESSTRTRLPAATWSWADRSSRSGPWP